MSQGLATMRVVVALMSAVAVPALTGSTALALLAANWAVVTSSLLAQQEKEETKGDNYLAMILVVAVAVSRAVVVVLAAHLLVGTDKKMAGELRVVAMVLAVAVAVAVSKAVVVVLAAHLLVGTDKEMAGESRVVTIVVAVAVRRVVGAGREVHLPVGTEREMAGESRAEGAENRVAGGVLLGVIHEMARWYFPDIQCMPCICIVDSLSRDCWGTSRSKLQRQGHPGRRLHKL